MNTTTAETVVFRKSARNCVPKNTHKDQVKIPFYKNGRDVVRMREIYQQLAAFVVRLITPRKGGGRGMLIN
jgi:hypothetical protein